MKPKKHLSFTSLRKCLSGFFHKIVDGRKRERIEYSLHDGLMSGFSCLYFIDPSILQFQKRIEIKHHTNNLKTMFGLQIIPEPTQLRDMIDGADGKQLGGFLRKRLGDYKEASI